MEYTGDINALEVPQLQALVTKFPWFSYAREVLLYKLVQIEPQCLESRYKESLVFFPMRENVLLRCRGIVAEKTARPEDEAMEVPVAELLDAGEGEYLSGSEVEPLEELSLEMDFDFSSSADQGKERDFFFEVEEEVREQHENVVEIQAAKPKIVVVGADYFSKEDFAQLEDSERAAEIRLGAPAQGQDIPPQGAEADEVDFDAMDFVTETLAKIYADQGYYDKAIEVYAKLILLYPEKSTYFATLVNEIKSKN